jgi:HD-GYP domain-containing protein (c-di-GMP phosphodiesterase class II)/HAMP domain-containing protein
VFLLFLACAIVPVGVLGVFSWLRSSQELERATREQLRRDSKREGMAILSRLLVADALLADWDERSAASFAAQRTPAARPFRSVRSVDGEAVPGGPLGGEEALALARGAPVLRALDGGGVMLLRAAQGPGGARILAAEVEPAYLWTFDMQDVEASLTVADDRGVLLFSTLPAATARAVAAQRAAAAGSVRSGATQGQLAEPWLLFLGGHFASPSWRIVRGEPSEATLAPLAEFRSVFGWSALLALFVVAALSSVQIRRTLGPVQRLAAAAERLGDGDLSARAGIAAHDEFGALGDVFDKMAARIERNVHGLASASDLGLALSGESSEVQLVSLLLKALTNVAHCRGAAFVRSEPSGTLLAEGVLGDWPGISPAVREAFARGGEVHGEGESVQVALPIADHHRHVVAVLQIWGPRDDDGGDSPRFRAAELAAARSLAAQAAIAFANRRLVEEFRTLFEGLIELTITALDAKSAYTAGHCRRVPILAEMLAEALCETREGPFASFSFTPEQRYELHIAALLHDFGKIVTPVHVMDKSTKLETIHDRIELVATRYAVVEREAEIAWLRGELTRANRDPGEWRGLPELAAELAFLRAQNHGVEALLPEAREHILAIAGARRWRKLGGEAAPILDADELENLTISRGTLTEAERKVIEEHADYTIKLLARLPFPPHLRGVPHIAGSHHERVCGGGYPLGLRGEQITLQGRLLGIADVFEALTAPDRPYREPMSVGAALEQLREMTKRGFLDADLFDVFVREGVHLRYAREQLRPEQLDDASLDALARIPGGPLPPG